jgi:predicted phage terminase large subunit-like protein
VLPACGCESNGFQDVLRGNLAPALKAAGLGEVNVRGIENTTNKQGRIESLEPLTTSGKVRLRADWSKVYPLLMDQLLSFPQDAHDDGPDALQCLASLARVGKPRSNESAEYESLESSRRLVRY